MKNHINYKILVFYMISLFNYPYILQAHEYEKLTIDDLVDFNKVIAYRNNASNEDRKKSSRLYEDALKHHDPGSSVKLLLESILFYPSSRVYFKFIEYRLKQFSYREIALKHRILNKTIRYSYVAIELNKLDKMLSEAEVRIINHNITCIKKHIDVKKNISDCKALEWIEI